MAVNEHSVGPVYLSFPRLGRWMFLPRWLFPPHVVGIVEMVAPWRRGKGILIPFLPGKGLVIGIWHRTIDQDIDEDFLDDRWFDPRWLNASEIPGWGVDLDVSEQNVEGLDGRSGDPYPDFED